MTDFQVSSAVGQSVAEHCEAPIRTFTFDAHGLTFDIRTVALSDGEPGFVAADVLAALTLDRKALERLDDDEKGVSSIHTLGGAQDMTVVTEPGLYSLILGSRKPDAKAFKRWVTHEVLPELRKRGVYTLPESADVLMARALIVAQETIAKAQESVACLETRLTKQAPHMSFVRQVVAADGEFSVREAAKMLGTGEKRLFQLLRNLRIFTSGNEPMQRHVDLGRFRLAVASYVDSGDRTHIHHKPVVTGKGLRFLHDVLTREGWAPKSLELANLEVV